jgi:hypothetical protein
MEADNLNSTHASRDTEWRARQPRLDRALAEVIRAPAVNARFDEQVWALIRADEAEALAMRTTWGTRLGTPWWLDALNVVAVAVTAVAVTLALRSVAAKPLAATAAAALTFVGHSTGSVLLALFASAAGLWFAWRQTPLARANTPWL